MLEVARLWQEQQFQPRRSVLFVSWAGGELPYSGAHYFRDRRGGFITHYTISSVIHLDRLGGTDGAELVVRPLGQRNQTLFNLLVNSANRLEVNVAQGLAAQTVLGTAKLILARQMHPADLKEMVTSPGGTTIAGLHALEQRKLRAALMDAVLAAADRSRELSGD